ncbi:MULTISPECIES: DUF488 family protein [Rhodomicrobium]|uniref:DUF488 domain-containing protein n=1 Tax=Rhodomicrobium TaxID=1068 RepID=UPI000B4B7EBE|nr:MULTISPECIES: DUF488 family protein [Rhodomicrobium]
MSVKTHVFALKRVYEPPSPEDGTRVLVDRLWPRGLSKEKAAVDLWLKDVAPSDELRHIFHGHPDDWGEFAAAYAKELAAEPARSAAEELRALPGKGRVTLLYASRDETHNNAVVLKRLLEG